VCERDERTRDIWDEWDYTRNFHTGNHYEEWGWRMEGLLILGGGDVMSIEGYICGNRTQEVNIISKVDK